MAAELATAEVAEDIMPAPSAEVLAVVQPGWVPVARQAAFIRAVEASADEQGVRRDGRRNLLEVAWVYARRTDWRPEASMLSSPSRALVMELTGLSDATVKRWTSWMVKHGPMAQLEVGRLARFRPMAVQAEGGRVSVYVLCQPAPSMAAASGREPAPMSNDHDVSVHPVDKNDPSVVSVFSFKKNPYASAREAPAGPVGASLVANQKRSDKRGEPRWPHSAAAGSRTDRLALVETLQASAPALRPASARALRSELRPWLERPELGWTVRWLLHALDHTPDGQPHPYTAAVRVPVRWLAHRMSLWLDEQGRPLPAPGVLHAAERSAQRAETAAAAAERRGLDGQREREQLRARL
jgi:hypothetical protein